ncbi:MAG: hypothetical protein IJP26_04920, partial [Clostridia bacterium]|nr:hypothetical protein [Clostridia bacterium]
MKFLFNIKEFFIKHKTLLIVAGVAVILFAAFFVYKTVSFKEIIVVCSDASVTDGIKDINGNTLKVFEKIPDAIDYLSGQEGTIYIKGNVKATTLESKAETRGEITFQGYLGLSDGNTLTVSNADALYKGDITFKNITLNNANNNEGFYSAGHVITFGEGVVTGNNGTKTINLGSGGVTAGNNNINIYSGNFCNLSVFYGLTEGKDYTINTTYNINGGTVNNAIIGAHSDVAGVTKISGNVTYNINGGVIENLNMGANSESHISYVLGNAVINVNGGKFLNGINFADTSDAAFMGNLNNTQSRGNIALVINSANVENSFEILNKDNIGKNMLKAENKKFAAIINNYQAGNVKFSENLEHIDYKITVTGGTAEPVFELNDESAPESAVLVGFKIKSNDTQNKYLVPRINGNKACFKDNTDYYDLTSYEQSNVINIDFVEDKIPVLTGDTNFTPNENEQVFNTVSSALEYLGISGGKIAVKGNVSLENLTVSGSVQNPVTFYGYDGNEAHINLAGSDWSGFNGNLNFENIKVTFNSNDLKFISGSKTITCQNGVICN